MEELLKQSSYVTIQQEIYMSICDLYADNLCKCFSQHIGALLVKGEVIVPGYNGPPRKFDHCDKRNKGIKECPRQTQGFKSGEGLDICVATHAEVNALINASRWGIKTYGSDLYMNCSIPCKDCMKEIVNFGVKRLFFDIGQKSYPGYELSYDIAMQAGVELHPLRRLKSFKTSVRKIK